MDGPYVSEPMNTRLVTFESSSMLTNAAIQKLNADQRTRSEIIELKAGMILVFSQFLCDRSGKNMSSLPRMSMQVRFSYLGDSFFKNVGFYFSKDHTIGFYA